VLWSRATSFQHFTVWELITLYLFFIGIYLVIINSITTIVVFRRFALSFLLGGVLAATIAIFRSFQGSAFLLQRAVALSDQNANFFGANMAVGFIVSLYFFLTTKRLSLRLMIVAASSLLLLALMLSGSRMAWLSIAAALAISAMIAKPVSWRRMIPSVILTALLCVVGFYVISFTKFIPTDMIHNVRQRATFEYAIENQMGLRMGIWQVGWEMAKHNPFFGVGLRNFPVAIEQYRSLLREDLIIWSPWPHSIYLSVLGELGIVGLLLLLLILGFSFWYALRCQDTVHRFLALAIVIFLSVAGLVAELQIFAWFWLMLALSYVTVVTHK